MQTKQAIKKFERFVSILIIFSIFYYLFGLSQSAAKTETEANYPDVPRIGANEALKLFKSGKAFIADVDDRERHKDKRIFGSLSIPREGSERLIGKIKVRVPEGKMLLLYCR